MHLKLTKTTESIKVSNGTNQDNLHKLYILNSSIKHSTKHHYKSTYTCHYNLDQTIKNYQIYVGECDRSPTDFQFDRAFDYL